MNKSGQSSTNTAKMDSTTPPLSKTATQPTNSNDVVVDGCQESVSLKKGQKMIVKLPATEATGYIWQIKDPLTILINNESDVIQYEKQPSEPGMVGKASKQLIHFTASQVGTETLSLVYLRPFDKDNVAELCNIRLTVK